MPSAVAVVIFIVGVLVLYFVVVYLHNLLDRYMDGK